MQPPSHCGPLDNAALTVATELSTESGIVMHIAQSDAVALRSTGSIAHSSFFWKKGESSGYQKPQIRRHDVTRTADNGQQHA